MREALVIDEHGGTAGLVTFDTLMSRIVGDLGGSVGGGQIALHADGSADINGLALVTDVNEQFDLAIDESVYDDDWRLRPRASGPAAPGRRDDRDRGTPDAGHGPRRPSRVEGLAVETASQADGPRPS